MLRSSHAALIYLINDLLDFSKIESGHLELEAATFDLRALVDEVLGVLAPMVHEKRGALELAALVGDSVPQTMIGDPTRIAQVTNGGVVGLGFRV